MNVGDGGDLRVSHVAPVLGDQDEGTSARSQRHGPAGNRPHVAVGVPDDEGNHRPGAVAEADARRALQDARTGVIAEDEDEAVFAGLR